MALGNEVFYLAILHPKDGFEVFGMTSSGLKLKIRVYYNEGDNIVNFANGHRKLIIVSSKFLEQKNQRGKLELQAYHLFCYKIRKLNFF